MYPNIDEVQAASFFFSRAGYRQGKWRSRRRSGYESGHGAGKQRNKDGYFPLLGKGVLIGIVDSGIDYENPDFRNVDGYQRELQHYGIRQ